MVVGNVSHFRWGISQFLKPERGHGHRLVTRVYGPDLMLAVCGAGRAAGLTHYFYGGVPGVAEELRARRTSRRSTPDC